MPQAYNNIPGWFNYSVIYDIAIDYCQNRSTFVELGTFLGKSACYFVERSNELGKSVSVFSVDIFPDIHLGNTTESLQPPIRNPKGLRFKDLAIDYLEHAGVKKQVTLIEGFTTEVVVRFLPQSIDFLWIDADHEYQHVLNDLTSWYPRLKTRAFIAGHDYHLPDVRRAVDDFFGVLGIPVQSHDPYEGWYIQPGTFLRSTGGISEFGCLTFNERTYGCETSLAF